MGAMGKYLFIFISISAIVVRLDAVTVSPALCPTNKIAPHRRLASWDQSRPRTFGLIYDLFAPRRPPQMDPLNDLQEQPQEDDPDDCGEIDDYDETDLSSVTNGGQRKKTDRKDRYLFGNDYNKPPYYPVPSRPPPHRPLRPTRPPYNFEGIYGSNFYRPPPHLYPSGHIKPVKEDTLDSPQTSYRPGLIGGNLGHIVGFAPMRPTTEVPTHRQPMHPFRFPESDTYMNRRQKKSQQSNRSTSILGSFVDLLFN